MSASSSTAATAVEFDADVWRAIAGAFIKIPPLNSYVYYFPQGHLEQSSASAAASAEAEIRDSDIKLECPFIPCQVVSIRFLSNNFSDQVFVKFVLQPVHAWEQRSETNIGDSGESDVVSFAKVLTPSDANNGGGFSVPRFCAESIFPPLDFAADPPVQNLTIKDTLNHAWEFRHIYRGTPRRHLLTTGWSKFVNANRLIAGDCVVFMRKKSTNELFIGVRRAEKLGSGRSRDCGENCGNSSTCEVVEAMAKAAKGMAFEVVYYPRVGLPDFVVSAQKVEDSLRMCWSAGMRVKMEVETDDGLQTTWFQGTIEAITLPNSGPWRGSPWGMLHVIWDEPENFLNIKNRVSPWQIEYVTHTSDLHSAIPLPKRFKALPNSQILIDGEGEFCFPMTELPSSIAGGMNSELLNYSRFPSAGIQEARRDQISISRLSNFQCDNSYQSFTDLLQFGIEPEVRTVSTVVNIGSPLSENLSPASQSSVHYSDADLVSQQGHDPSTKSVGSPFRLFGQIIQMPQPCEGGSKNNLSSTDLKRKGVDTEGNVIVNPLHLSPRQASAAETLMVISKELQL